MDARNLSTRFLVNFRPAKRRAFLGFMSTAIHWEFSLYFASEVRKKDAMDGSLWSAARRLAASCQASPIEEDVSLILEFLKRSLVLRY